MNISYFQNIADKHPVIIGIERLIEKIRNGSYADLVDKVRNAKTDEERTKAKKRLPAVTVSGIFEGGHKAEQLVSHSGLIQIDFLIKWTMWLGLKGSWSPTRILWSLLFRQAEQV